MPIYVTNVALCWRLLNALRHFGEQVLEPPRLSIGLPQISHVTLIGAISGCVTGVLSVTLFKAQFIH